MRTKPFYQCLAAILLAFLIMPRIGLAGDYEIVKVIEVGPCSGAPMLGPLKWSPDGTKLSYFYAGSLYISDTLGNSQEIIKFDESPHSYEWLSDKEIVIHLKELRPKGANYNKLVRLDITTSEFEVLEEYLRELGVRYSSNPKSFQGPWYTAEGNLYYLTNVIHSTTRKNAKLFEPEPAHLIQSSYVRKSDKPSLNDQHYYSWGDDGLYKVKLDYTDSALVGLKPYQYMILPPEVNTDMTYYIHGGTMYSFKDSMYIVLDTIIKEFPPNTGATGMLYGSFNPKNTEVLFEIIYHDGDQYQEFAIGTFNYITNRFKIIDQIINMRQCQTPAYAADGRKIAFLSECKSYIIYTEVK